MQIALAEQPAHTAAAPAPRLYEPELDVLRFCAFLVVFSFHALPSDYGMLVPRFGPAIPAVLSAARDAMSYGVCIFFLLSSYLITKLLLVERASTGDIHLKSFYIRRVLRIWPLYLGFLLLMWALGSPLIHIFPQIENGRLLAFLLFSGNIYTGIFGFTENPILPLWTVSIEEQFYILWPGIARAGNAFLKAAAWAVIAIAIVSVFVVRMYAANGAMAVWTSSLVHFQFFALGSLLAQHFAKRLPTYSDTARGAMCLAGMLLMLAAAGVFHVSSGSRASAASLTVGYEVMAGGVVLIFLAFLGAARGRRVPAWLTHLGKISYGLYVFHFLSLTVCKSLADRFNIHGGFRTVGGAAMTLALALLSYRFFEKPFLLLKDRFSLVQGRPA